MSPYQQTSGRAATAANGRLTENDEIVTTRCLSRPLKLGIHRLAAYDPVLDDEIVRAAVGAVEA
jgi:hypothetical protein